MKTSIIVSIVFAILVLFIGGCSAAWGISLSNREVDLRTRIEAKQLDNKNQLANLKAKISQTGQVTEKEAEILTNVFVKYAEARNNGKGSGQLFTMVTEAVPTLNLQTVRNLQNIIESSRNEWAFKQTELLSLDQQHKRLLREFPNNLLFGMLGRKEINVVIVTSSETEQAFKTGVDDNDKVFK